MSRNANLSIGTVAERTGISVPTVRFYEERELISSSRNAGGQRRFPREIIRRISFIRIAQKLGFSLEEIGDQLKHLPQGRTPTKKDWERLSKQFTRDIDQRILELTQLRDNLSQCIGCGCLSLSSCRLANPADILSEKGPGPRFLMGDKH